MKMKKGCLGCGATLFLAFVAFSAWFYAASTYYVEAYKPEDVVASKDAAALRDRFTTFELDLARVHLEWNTYDNDVINEAPYKLLVVVEPLAPELRAVQISSLEVTSSLGSEYAFDESIEWPIIAEIAGDTTRLSWKFDPGFMFRFDDQEIVSSRVVLAFDDGAHLSEHSLDVRWMPVHVRHVAPIV